MVRGNKIIPLLVSLVTLFIILPQLEAANLLTNPYFEVDLNNDCTPDGWRFIHASGKHSTYMDYSRSVSGAYSLLVACSEDGTSDWRIEDTFVPIDSSQCYKASVWVYTDNTSRGSHALEVQWFDASGIISTDYIQTTKKNQWEHLVMEGLTPPQGTIRAAFLLRVYKKGNYFFDDVYLGIDPHGKPGKKGKEGFEGHEAGNLVSNPGFEANSGSGGDPESWEFSAPFGEYIAGIDSEIFNSGESSVKITCLVDGTADWRPAGTFIPIDDSKKYKASVFVYSDNVSVGSHALEAQWFSDSGYFNTQKVSATEKNQWQEIVLDELVPPRGATKLALLLRVYQKGVYYFDDVTLQMASSVVDISPEDEVQALRLSLVAPYFRGNIYASNPIKEIQGNIVINDETITKVDLVFSSQQEQLFVKEYTVKKGVYPFAIPAESLADGKYTITLTAYDGEGSVVETKEQEINKLPPAPVEVVVRDDNMLLYNGEPFFPIGLWTPPLTSSAFRQYSDAGFNFLLMNAASDYLLNEAEKNNLKIVAKVTPEAPLAELEQAKWKAEQAERIAKYQDHPVLLAYFIADEHLWLGRPFEPLMASYQIHKELDPYRPLWQNHAPRDTVQRLAVYDRACDISSVDIYPVPEGSGHSELADKTLSSVGKYTLKSREVTKDEKPVWMVLQGFSWNHMSNPQSVGVYPTAHQLRFMTYDAIVHGSMGVSYWGVHYIVEPSFWKDLFTVSTEVSSLTDVLTSPTLSCNKVIVNQEEVVLLYKVVNDWDYLIAVNTSKQHQKVNFSTPFKGAEIKVLFEERALALNGGNFQDEFGPQDVHIYTNNPNEQRLSAVKLAPSLTEFWDSKEPEDYEGTANWIWYPGGQEDYFRSFFRYSFNLTEDVAKANVLITADDEYLLYVNGELVGYDTSELGCSQGVSGWEVGEEFDLKPYLRKGKNVIAIEAKDSGLAPCALLFDLELNTARGKKMKIVSDDSWLTSDQEVEGWQELDFNDRNWKKAEIIAPYGQGPWEYRLKIRRLD